jgi:cytochrome c553
MNRMVALIMFSTFTFVSLWAQAADIEVGKQKAQACAACHGADGKSPNELWPNLAGQKAGYLAKQLKAFRDGTRTDPMMTPFAKPLKDADIENLAAYFSSLQ